ncbi:[FeFe] hydrogenase H-cluster radical SAM maturase HydG [Candidatus Auribacterota bacterium]
MSGRSTDIKSWANDRVIESEITKYLDNGRDFINDADIRAKISANVVTDGRKIKDILDRSLAIETLTPDETAALLNVEDPDLLSEMRETALKIKKKVYDNRIVTFAPLYMGNLCVNNCMYCGFRCTNEDAYRSVLSLDEIRGETEVLTGKIGHKRIIAVYGEHPSMDIEYIISSMKAVYGVNVKTKHGRGNIRRINVNAPPLSVDELKRLHDTGIGTYQVFQETYHPGTYAYLHPKGTVKGDYRWRLYCMHRAMEAGIDDVGIGVLFGLYEPKYEVMGLVYHALELEKRYGIGPHTVSFPRLEPALNTPYTEKPNYKVTDDFFKKLITVIRLAIPYTGMIITARENAKMRTDALKLGITQTDASTRIGIGSYSSDNSGQEGAKQQFILGDTRSLDELVKEFSGLGFITSFCTAGYRCGRTGKCIMDLLRSGAEGKFCKLNAVLTFREWLDDFATPETKAAGENIIKKEIEEISRTMPSIYPKFITYYERILNGERDLYL